MSSIGKYTKPSLKPQLELDLSGDRAQALQDEAQACRQVACALQAIKAGRPNTEDVTLDMLQQVL